LIASSGVGVVYVTHRLAEVFELADEVTVLRDGRVVLTAAAADTNLGEIVEAIAGGAVQGSEEPDAEHLDRSDQARAQPPVLDVRGLQVGTKLQDVSFNVCQAEILGVTGLAGSGRSTLLKALFGAVHRRAGDIRVSGRKVNLNSLAHAIKDGIYLIPEDRKTEGLVLSHSIEANLVVSILGRLLRPSDADSVADRCGFPDPGEPTPYHAADVCAACLPAAIAENTISCAWLLLALCH
jgi:ribose transport system ATP-binding protein